jgi:hypothetical protein
MVDEFRVLFATSQALSLSGRIEGLVGLQEAVSHTAPVNLGSRDPATWVVAYPDATVGSPGGGSLVSSSEVATCPSLLAFLQNDGGIWILLFRTRESRP